MIITQFGTALITAFWNQPNPGASLKQISVNADGSELWGVNNVGKVFRS